MFVYHYKRYYTSGFREYSTLKEALDSAEHDIEYNQAYPLKIEKDGEIILDADAILGIIIKRERGIA